MTIGSMDNTDTACSAVNCLVIQPKDYQVVYCDKTALATFPALSPGHICYRAFGGVIPCAYCPVPHIAHASFTASVQPGKNAQDSDVVSLMLLSESGEPLVLLHHGRFDATRSTRWLADKHCQAILEQAHIIAFEYNLDTAENFVSSHVSEHLAGNYDGKRTLSNIMLEDGVIHPDDVASSLHFRQDIMSQVGSEELSLRLKCRDGIFRWHKMSCRLVKEPHGTGVQRFILGTLNNIDEEMRLRESLRYRAEFDALTGIWNKDTFLLKTQNLLHHEPDKRRAIVKLDIDHFKIVNELFGVAEGDYILHFFAEILKNFLREGEYVARMGNDVFALCLSRDKPEIVSLLEQASATLNDYPLDFNFFVSAGIYLFDHYDNQPINLLCDRAGLAQKKIKGNFSRHYAFYEKEMGAAFAREHFITANMHRGIMQGEFLLYLQPKFDVQTESMVGAEALVRWNHPKEGLIPPCEFISLFERNGFIVKLDEYMWELACMTLRRWIDAGFSPIPVSVNVSRVHLYDTSLCHKLLHLIEKYQLEPRLLELEITESAYVENPQSIYSIMEQIQSKGFTFLMDDFGSGYSSLSMLKDIPVNILKIDLNFLKKSKRGHTGEAILDATLQMAKSLDFSVVAEGVETREQVDFLLRLGCKEAQGYYFDRPMLISAFEEKFFHRVSSPPLAALSR